jgi:uncharacterized HAD superfamily protein
MKKSNVTVDTDGTITVTQDWVDGYYKHWLRNFMRTLLDKSSGKIE